LLVLPALLLGLAGVTAATAISASATTTTGTTWYVTSAGTASGCASPAGTSSDPFGTIAGALACAADGDKISVGAGNFAGGFTVPVNVTIEGAGAFGTTITGLASTVSPAPPSEVTLAPGVMATLDGLTVTGSDFTNAVSMTGGALVLDQAFLQDAGPSSAGAVVSASPASGTAASVTVEASTIATGVTSSDAGLVVHYNGAAGSLGTDMSTVSILNSTVEAAAVTTAAVTVLNTNVSLLDDTIDASALQALRAIDDSSVTVGGTVLASDDADAVECEAGFTDLGNNLSSGDAANHGCNLTNGANGDIVSTTELSPGLGALADNGGPTPTMALLAGSPAIDANSISNCTSSLVNGLDQRGDPRNAAARGACDIGAYDTGGTPHTTWYVASAGTATGCASPAGTSSDPFGTIPAALACAEDGDLVSVGPGSFTGGFTVADNVVIKGAGANQTLVGGAPSASQLSGELTIAPAAHVVLSDLTVDGSLGNVAVDMTDANLVLMGVVAEDTGFTGGATVYAKPPGGTTAEVEVLGSTVSGGNDTAVAVVAANGLQYGAAATLTSTATIINSTLSSQAGEVGGVFANQANLDLLDDTVADAGNFAVLGSATSTLTIRGTILTGAGSSASDCRGFTTANLIDEGNNLVSGPGNCTFSKGVDGDLVGSSSSPLNADLGALGYYGGTTPTMPLEAGSPAIGANSVANCTGLLVNDLDQRGDPRNADARGACDIGAYDTGSNGTPLTWGGGPAFGPSARSYPAMATDTSPSDESYGFTLVFGGIGPRGYAGDTWHLSTAGFDWQDVNAATTDAPSARAGASLVWDAAMGDFVLFGGVNSKGFQGDTWAFDPTTEQWSQLSPTASPTPRAIAAMAALPNGDIVLFGGLTYTGYLGDTWVYSPSTSKWTEVATSGPSARWGAAMAADPTTGTAVLFGGAGRSGFDGGTWSFDPTSDAWSEVTTSGTAPSARAGTGLTYDTAAGKFVLVDGETSSGYSNGTYTFSPSTSTWSRLSPATSPTPRAEAALTYDPVTNRLVQFGGYSSGGYQADTWELEGQL
jgi:N-acetylneuraminic acid mutarotase